MISFRCDIDDNLLPVEFFIGNLEEDLIAFNFLLNNWHIFIIFGVNGNIEAVWIPSWNLIGGRESVDLSKVINASINRDLRLEVTSDSVARVLSVELHPIKCTLGSLNV